MALDPRKLPQTSARTAPSITIKATNKLGQEFTIGAVKSFTRTIDRQATRRFELDQDIPGRTVEIIPGAVNNISITLSRAMLYRASMLDEFGFTGVEDLVEQNIPFQIIEVRHSAKGNPAQIVTYHGCYFTSNPISVNIDGDWQIIQDAGIIVSHISVEGGPTDPA
jgi:hypothetical protein